MKQHKCCRKPPMICQIYKGIFIIIPMILILRYLYMNSSLYYRNDIDLPFSFRLNRQDLIMVKGEEFRLTVFGINKRISYSSTNFRVAWVNFNGRIFAVQPGKAFIIAKVDGKKLKCRVTVIDINKKLLALNKKDKTYLKVRGTNSIIRWTSSNPKVASVNFFGRVKARRKGYTVIRASVKGKVLTCTVFVT